MTNLNEAAGEAECREKTARARESALKAGVQFAPFPPGYDWDGRPYTFDNPAYARCYADPFTATDKRHVYMIHDVLMAWPFRETLEIGSFQGASSTAFIEAINKGHELNATFCDIQPSGSLLDVLHSCQKPNRTRLTMQFSWTVLASDLPFDFIFVDTAHDADTVSLELKHLLRRKPLCVMAHDTNATAAGHPKCEGAANLAKAFRETRGYYCIEDTLYRHGEQTERGLFLATRDLPLYYGALLVFADQAS